MYYPILKNKNIPSLLFYLLLCGFFCMSCCTTDMKQMEMNMKDMTKNTTATYFNRYHVSYIDSIISVQKNYYHIHFIETGNVDSPTLILIHGSPGSWSAFKRYVADSLLRAKFHIIALDRLGFGESDLGSSQNLEKQSSIILQGLSLLHLKKPIILVGHSLGGSLVVRMAIDSPQMIKKIIIVSGAVNPQAETPELWRPILIYSPLRYLVPISLRVANDELWWLKKSLRTMKTLLPRIACNIIIIHGTKDQLVPYTKNVDFMLQQFVHAKSIQLISIPNANHFIPWTHYDIIKNILLQSNI